MALLEVRDITKRFGALTVLEGVNLDVNRGEILGLIGPNGAGKTTLFNIISGLFRPNSGKIYFKGENLIEKPFLRRFFQRFYYPRRSMEEVTQKGVVRTFQTPTIWDTRTCLTNVLTALHMYRKTGFWESFFNTRSARAHLQEDLARAMELLSFMGLDGMANEMTEAQSFGRRRGLGIAIALAAEPELLMLDEPVTGMMASETERMMDRIRKIRDELGVTILLVEHHMKFVMGLCDRIVALNFGRKIAEGSPEEVAANQGVIEAYLGVE